ncbi:MAG: ATP-dependent acyl-CoA ligase [Nocardioidaceae bacterium]
MAIPLRRCDACGHCHFPPREVCPECHGRTFSGCEATRGTIEQVTTLGADGHALADIRTDAGPRLVGRVDPDSAAGTVVSLSPHPDIVGTAYVPAAGSTRLPSRSHPLRDLPLDECTVPRLLARQAARYGDKPLLIWADEIVTYGELLERVARTAGTLRAGGVEPGDRVAVWSANRIELLELVLGCAWRGAVAVPLNTALRGSGLRHALTDSGAAILVLEGELLAPLADAGVPATVRELWLFDGADGGDRPPGLDVPIVPYPAPGADADPEPAGPGDTAAILYTSGTTGLPKGVRCPHAQFYWWGVTVSECLGIDERDTLYTCLPLFHTNALNAFFQALVSGATFVLGRRFSASRFWSDVAGCGATVTYLLGAMVEILRAGPASSLDAAHDVRIALAPATPAPAHRDFLDRFGIRLVEGYGSTETNMVVGAHHEAQRPGAMGLTLPDFETRVVDECDVEVPVGAAGRLLCRSRRPFAFATGYHGDPAATAEAWRDGWFHTGDRVVRDAHGWIRFVDRINDSIRRRGENISSLEVEDALRAHPAVVSAAVYAVPSELAEDEVMAAVVPAVGHSVEPHDLVDWCGPRLPSFAVPRFVEVRSSLPYTENGKVQKSALRDRGVTEHTWDRDRQ